MLIATNSICTTYIYAYTYLFICWFWMLDMINLDTDNNVTLLDILRHTQSIQIAEFPLYKRRNLPRSKMNLNYFFHIWVCLAESRIMKITNNFRPLLSYHVPQNIKQYRKIRRSINYMHIVMLWYYSTNSHISTFANIQTVWKSRFL